MNSLLTRIRRLGVAALSALCLTASLPISVAHAQAASPTSRLLIDEIQTGGCSAGNVITTCTEDTKMEFIRLHNYSNESLSLQGWKLQYLSASGQTITDLSALEGVVSANGDILIAHTGYFEPADRLFGTITDTGKLAKSGGMIRLIDGSGAVADLAGWGNATKPDTRWQITIQINPGYSIRRVQPLDLIASGGQSVFSFPSYPPTPRGGDLTDGRPADAITPAPSNPLISTCAEVEITEILPNPAGSDTDHEFIELHNRSDKPVSLAGCVLRTSANSKKYVIGNLQLAVNAYLVLDNKTTGLTMTNSAGGSITLSDGATDLQTVTYTKDMADDEAWVLIGSSWLASVYATPGSANILSVLDTPTASTSSAVPIEACSTGKERNPETGRCRNIIVAPTAVACKSDQVRNPITNRCAKIPAASQTVCRADQARNPATGRCKNVTSAATKKPCTTGQVRNPATGRCKKDAASAKLASVKDVRGNQVAKDARWVLLFVALGVAVAYGCYEWRQELRDKFRKFPILKQPRKLTFQRK